MKKLIFITGNKNKLCEVQAVLPFVEAEAIDLPEIQEVDARKVIEAKLAEAYKLNKGEYIVEDTSLYLGGLNDLPGPLIKWFWESLGGEKIYQIAKSQGNLKARARTIFGHIDSLGKINYYEGVVEGEIVSPRGETDFAWDVIFQPVGFDKTFAEMGTEEKNKISMRRLALDKLVVALTEK